MSKPCLICGGLLRASRIPGLLACTSCGFVTADITISDDELRQLYSANYFAGEEYNDYVGERTIIEENFRNRLATLRMQVGDTAGKRLFEVGCAYGFFLSVARHHFKEVSGIDVSADATAYARAELGLSATAGEFLTHPVPTPVEVVCLWDTIEHLADPDGYIARAVEILAPGGHLALTTGDIESMVARVRGRNWRQIHPPTHLHYFSRRTMTRLLEKHGLVVTYAGHDGMYRSVEMMAHIVLRVRHNQPRLFATLKRLGLLDWRAYINLFDIMYVIAQKPVRPRPDSGR